MRSLLICPAFRPAVAPLVDSRPPATIPVCGEPLVNVWLEHVAALGARQVTLMISDRPELVKAAAGDGRRWGIDIEFVANHPEPTRAEAAARYRAAGERGWLSAPDDIVVMDELPGCPGLPLFESYAGWFGALRAWMPRALTSARVCVRETRPGIWIGGGSRISPCAQLQAPCWIGDHVSIGAGASIGPCAIVEDRVVVEQGARIAHSHVGPDTLVGRMTAIEQSFAAGSLLINWRSESVLRVPDSFLLSSLVDGPSAAPDGNLATAMVRSLRQWVPRFFRTHRTGDANLPG